MYKLLLTYNNRTKKIVLDLDCLKKLETEVQEKFSISSAFYMQYFDKEVEEYVDLDSIDNLEQENFVKIRIFLSDPCSDTPIKAATEATSTSSDIADQPSTPSQDDLPAIYRPKRTENVSPVHVPTTPKPHMKSDSGLSTTWSSPVVVGSKRTTKQWPKVYTFPSYTIPISTMVKLENIQPLSAKDRRDILTGIYQDVTSFEGGLYPTADRYDAIIDGIFRKFPNITSHEGLSVENSRDLWKDRLKTKFQNSRRRIDGSLPEIVSKKRKKKQEESLEESSGPSTWGLKKYLPALPESEDNDTSESHIGWLQREFKKRTGCDEEGVDRRMTLTLHHRRKIVVQEKQTVEEILLLYPWLGSVPQLIKEFLRLGPSLPSPDVMSSFVANLKKYGSTICALANNRKTATFGLETRKRGNSLRGDVERQYVENCSALLCLPSLFRENITSLVQTEEAHQTCEEPSRILISYEDILNQDKDSFKLVVESIIVFKCNSFIESMVGLMMAIYAFNLAYPKDLEKTMLLLQKVFLGVDDESPIDKKILNVMAQINQAM